MYIPDDDDINRGQKFVSFVANPNHCSEKEKPGNCFSQANLPKPFDNLLMRIFCEKVFYKVHRILSFRFRVLGFRACEFRRKKLLLITNCSLLIKRRSIQIFKNLRRQHWPYIFSGFYHISDFCSRKFDHGSID